MSTGLLTMPPRPVDGETMPDLASMAVTMLRAALRRSADENGDGPRERNVRRPDSWLLQRCWEVLGDAGEAEAALTVARLAAPRDRLSIPRALYRTAQSTTARSASESRDNPASICRPVIEELARQEGWLLGFAQPSNAEQIEALLYSAGAAAICGDVPRTFAYLERLDQLNGAWVEIFAALEERTVLASTLAILPPHALTSYLISSANRRHDEDGVNLVQMVAMAVDPQDRDGRRILDRCVEAMQHASLTTMHSHRAAVAVFARAGLADAMMRQLTTIATIQDARRESGLALRKNDQQLLRQVKRPQANADVDFQAYTLQEAVRSMPVRSIERDERIALAKQLAVLGMQSDGWTAAGTASTLVDLGAFKLAEEVVDHIAGTDPTRSEGAISLVRSLLENGEEALAVSETEKALAWAKEQEGKNAERATVWGLADVYLDRGRPDKALALLEQRRVQAGFWVRLRDRFRKTLTDDELRDDRLRLRARLQFGETGHEVDLLIAELWQWAPQLLDGEALLNFVIDGLLEPLLEAGRPDLVWEQQAELCVLLAKSGGDRHSMHVRHVAALFVTHLNAARVDDDVRRRLVDFVDTLWRADGQRGIWQLVHGIDGLLPLLLALEGPAAVIEIVTAIVDEAEAWEAAVL